MGWLGKKADAERPAPTAHGYWTEEAFGCVTQSCSIGLTLTRCASVLNAQGVEHEFTAVLSRSLGTSVEPIKCDLHFSAPRGTADDNRHGIGWFSFNGSDENGEGFWDTRSSRLRPKPQGALESSVYVPQIDIVLLPQDRTIVNELVQYCRDAAVRGGLVECRVILDAPVDWTWEQFAAATNWLSKRFTIEQFVSWNGFNFEHRLQRLRKS